ncbi:shikimate dehydrogenase [Sphingosinicella sp. BN140058]|uniref:shikimate dehydrogenase family protein n=1 Tax=Sphingosinicella sp. BN140058 TaxID=1892855 RepID=UPI001012826A|nr:shikimate dehydrogenase [Sphingosinicella sp. BN140058]QAY76892.1 shikimate dehydrogenase [Sphingosinicella sp. BN140058]
MTIPYAEVIGDPIAHSKSPLIHNFWLQKLGLAGEYRRTHVPADQLSYYLGRRREDEGWRGCNVTIPHKISIMQHLDAIDAAEVGAVNCIIPGASGLRGLNTDVLGLAEALSRCVARGPVLLLGTGGAARAAVAWVKSERYADLRLVARDRRKAEELLAEFGCQGEIYDYSSAADAMQGAIGILNATPMGMNGFASMPEDVLNALPRLRAGSFVLDMVYAPIETPLLRRATDLGFSAVDGLAMLIGQARSAFRLFFGETPPEEGDTELRAILTS